MGWSMARFLGVDAFAGAGRPAPGGPTRRRPGRRSTRPVHWPRSIAPPGESRPRIIRPLAIPGPGPPNGRHESGLDLGCPAPRLIRGERNGGRTKHYCRLNRMKPVLVSGPRSNVSMMNSPGPGWANRPWRKIWPCETRVRPGRLLPERSERVAPLDRGHFPVERVGLLGSSERNVPVWRDPFRTGIGQADGREGGPIGQAGERR